MGLKTVKALFGPDPADPNQPDPHHVVPRKRQTTLEFFKSMGGRAAEIEWIERRVQERRKLVAERIREARLKPGEDIDRLISEFVYGRQVSQYT